MRRITILTIALALGATATAAPLRVLTDRTESHLRPLLALFEQNTGIKVEAVYADKGMLTRLETRPTEADLVISSTAETMDVARSRHLLAPFSSATLEALDPAFVDPDKMYFITSYRPRCIFYHKERVKREELSTYTALIDPKWKGRVVIRSGYHAYNLSLFSQMAEAEGLEATRAFLIGLKANLARTPTGNDRSQVQALYEGKADVSIGNSYYMPIMQARDDQRPWADATSVFFPNQQAEGTYVMRSAAGLTKATRNRDAATQLLDFLLSDFAQFYFAKTLHVYPVKPAIPLGAATQQLAQGQPGIENGRFKARFVPVRDIAKHRDAVISILNEINFDDRF